MQIDDQLHFIKEGGERAVQLMKEGKMMSAFAKIMHMGKFVWERVEG